MIFPTGLSLHSDSNRHNRDPIEGLSLTPQYDVVLWLSEGFQEALSWAPMTPREDNYNSDRFFIAPKPLCYRWDYLKNTCVFGNKIVDFSILIIVVCFLTINIYHLYWSPFCFHCPYPDCCFFVVVFCPYIDRSCIFIAPILIVVVSQGSDYVYLYVYLSILLFIITGLGLRLPLRAAGPLPAPHCRHSGQPPPDDDGSGGDWWGIFMRLMWPRGEYGGFWWEEESNGATQSSTCCTICIFSDESLAPNISGAKELNLVRFKTRYIFGWL